MKDRYTTVEVYWKGYPALVSAVWRVEDDESITISEVLLGRQNIYDDLGYLAKSKIRIAVYEAASNYNERVEVQA